ncbi:UPF0481 protein At3g47200-like [Telopea speciosissima]|uniref:UPF0481 protein At3g47200-like n=1 Tax=Telopea speciosissima TaxID=54955 RepID=UPI001CC5EB63|nr:UPF0481 protein At3g47200-like [Telopea speciosissima]
MEKINIVSSQDSGENHVSIGIEIGNDQSILWSASIRQKLSERSNPSLGTTSCIYRVHQRIRKMNEDSYTPDMVSIGPYHRGRDKLQAMEDHKLQYVQSLLDRTRDRITLEKYVEALKELEPKARGFYSEPISLSSKEFVEMMLFDGFFLIELFRKNFNVVEVDDNDPIFYSNSRRARVVGDLVLVENQIPILVLQTLFDLSKDPNQDFQPLIKMALFYFHTLIPEAVHKYPQNNKNITHNHLLDLLCYTLDSSLPKVTKPRLSTTAHSLPCVSELRCAGVKFKKGHRSSSLIHIKFKEGVFEIPPLCIDDYTDSFFRNLIAYEQYRFDGAHYITSFAILMDYLINSDEDVAFLRGREIIKNHLGHDNKVSFLFSHLCSEVSNTDFYYSELCDEVNEYYSQRSNKWNATLKRDYCNSPWTIISVIAAIVLLFLTAWGTVFTTLQVFNVHA